MYLQSLSVEVSQTLQTHLLLPMMTAYQVFFFFFFFLWVAHLWLTEYRELPHSSGVQAHPKAAALHSSHRAVLVVREDRIAGVFPVC